MIGRLVISLFALFGVGMSLFAFVESTWIAAPVMTVMGIGNGFLGVTLITTLQRRTPTEMLGRVMSLLMLSMYALYLGVAAGMFALCALSFSRPEVRRFGEVGMGPELGSVAEVEPATA